MEPKLLLEKELEPIFLEKLPAFPENVKEPIAQYGPYVMLVLAIIGLFGLLTAFGIGTAAIGVGVAAYGGGFNFYIGIAFAALTMVLYLMAFTPLRARKRAGWNLIYYATLLNLVGSILQLNILGALIGAFIGFWILFQVRDKFVA
ncbi:hypothetical protein [Dyadobacter sp. CY312]|uniref:hypothetical protein n=1 Tax=Dyadobacter sp. CY312 TaxID=2907303 RepID=UPI001F290F83|nr:hypothetical protein [Dyadobacter sp. CY312]MCE7040874.1 hypothetical protein [Dyadobacter sp. CY312]